MVLDWFIDQQRFVAFALFYSIYSKGRRIAFTDRFHIAGCGYPHVIADEWLYGEEHKTK